MKKRLLSGLAIGLFMFGVVGMVNASPLSFSVITHDYGANNYLPTQGCGIYGVDASGVDYIKISKPSGPKFADVFNLSGYAYIDSLRIDVTHKDNWNYWYGWGYGEIWHAKADNNSFNIGRLGHSTQEWRTDHFDLSGYLPVLNNEDGDDIDYDLSSFLIHFTEHTASPPIETPKEEFLLDKITIFVEGEKSHPVPVPTTMLFFGSGLVGLFGARINRMKK